MAFSDVKVTFFCVCQEYLLNGKNKEYFINNMFKKSREITTEMSFEQVQDYLMPDQIIEFNIENILIKCYYRLYFHPLNLLKEIEELSKNILINKNIEEYFEASKKYAEEFLGKDNEDKKDILDISINIDSIFDYIRNHQIDVIWNDGKIMNIFETQEKYLKNIRRGFVCTKLTYDGKYRIIGDILPRSLPLPKNIESQVGETTVQGFNLNFEESEMGLEKVDIKKEKDGWFLQIRMRYGDANLRDFYPKGLELLMSISNLFMEEKLE